jgi:hypothetical protein
VSHDPPKQAIDYQSSRPAERLAQAPILSVILGFSSGIVDLLLCLGVFTNDAGYATPTLITIGIIMATSIIGLLFGIRGLRARKQRILFARAGITISLASLVALAWMVVYFFTHLPKS